MPATVPSALELGPFFPEASARGPLLERAEALLAEGHRLEAAGGHLAAALRPLLCTMNACHASELDGHPVRPGDIQEAIPASADADPGGRAHQLARAHVAAETGLLAALPTKSVGLYAPDFVQCIHAELHRTRACARASDVELASGPAPGAWRITSTNESAAAPADAIPELLDIWQGTYSKPFALEQAVLAALCAHQRLLWVCPFQHGNGRTARLHTHLVFTALGLTQRLWSPLRAMARDRDAYQASLQHGLADFARWALDASLAQARAARELLDAERLKRGLSDLLAWLAARPWVMGSEKSVIKPDALEALHYTALSGPVERARFIAMLGLQHRTGRRILSSLIDFGLLVSESSRAPVRFNLPLPSLRLLYPSIWPEAEALEEPRTSTRWVLPSPETSGAATELRSEP